MSIRAKIERSVASLAFVVLLVPQAFSQVPAAISSPDDVTVAAVLHAEGVQVYECKNSPDGKLTWQFREPVATLISGRDTVGRHYAGPHWEHSDGSTLRAKVVASSPGATPNDIPWLRLAVTNRRGSGIFSGVTTVQRITTKGGVAQGSCDRAGSLRSDPYSADYVFLRAD
jgi:hypothetical protein